MLLSRILAAALAVVAITLVVAPGQTAAAQDLPGLGDSTEALGLMAGADLSDPVVAATANMIMKPLYRGKPLTNEARGELIALPRR